MSKKIEIRCTNLTPNGNPCNKLLGSVTSGTVGIVTIWCPRCKKNEITLFTEKY